jgi:signal transduction histidine kinase
MAEINRTLRLLRTEDDGEGDRAPRPGLDSLERLLEQSRAAGIDVKLAIEGAPRPLSPSLDLSAFRIVQEALTNVRKHAGGADTRVKVGYGDDALELTIRNAPGHVSAAGNGGGHGLTGMRERAGLFGGTLVAGPSSDGFEVRAVLPYDAEPVL